MFKSIKRLARKNKGMEALQAVILLGAGFLIVWGLMTLWTGTAEPAMKEQIGTTIRGETTKAKAATTTTT